MVSKYRDRAAERVILAAEHEPRALWDICRLRCEGYRVIVACDGEQALDVFSYCGDKIDLALIDVSIPDISGFEVISRILQVRPDMKFLLVHCGEADNLEAIAPPEHKVIRKPFSYHQLLAGVRAAMNGDLAAMAAG